MKLETKVRIKKIGLGGGCHWCTEGVFQSLLGVSQVDQGWISSTGIHDYFSEAVIVHYDPNTITLSILIEIHLLTHSSTSNHSMRDKYRSAIYYFDDNDKNEIERIRNDLQNHFANPIITQILKFEAFKLNDDKFLNYYHNRPNASFCKNHIDPKIQQLSQSHNQYLIQKSKLS